MDDKPAGGIEGWREHWINGAPPNRRSGALGRLKDLIESLLVRSVGRTQRNFNIAVLEMIEDRRGDIDALRRDFEQIANDVRALEQKAPIAVERNDALFVALDQKIESALSRIRDLATPVIQTAPSPSFAEDWRYRRLEEALRGPADQVRRSLAPLVERLSDHQPVVDIGCGRGELLELCRDAGIDAQGFDVNERSVAELRSKGFEAKNLGLPECLTRFEDGSVGSVVAIHVVEHLPSELYMRLFDDAHRVLRGGGLLIIETPNAESMAMSAGEFWRDPTHLAPRHEASLVTLGREAGFSVDHLEKIHDWDPEHQLSVDEGAPAAVVALARQLNEILFAPADLRVILRKGS